MIKFIDLAAQNREIVCEVERDLATIHENTAYIDGPPVEAFEKEFAAFLGVGHVIGTGSGTDSLRLALIAAGIGAGDEVITAPLTFVATAEAIIQTGARPVFVDVDPRTCNLSVDELRRYVETKRWSTRNGPRAIVPIHLYGLPAAMNEIRKIAREHDLVVIEDACQAHGAGVRGPQRWERAGAMGDAGCFSFYPGKNLGAWGEAGAIATNNEQLADRVRRLRNHGRLSHYAHQECGYNARLDTIQAAVLRAKLKRLIAWNERRREIANSYQELLRDCEVELPAEPEDFLSCYHLFVIRSPHRDTIRQLLLENQVQCGIHYPVPLHLQPALRSLGHAPGDFLVSERIADTVLSLPMHPHLTNLEVVQVAEIVRDAVKSTPNSLAGGHRAQRAAFSPPAR
jgi:dTDP-4-amino-4,6-dideoxygalactose transaminase